MDNNYNYTGFPATYSPYLYYQPTTTQPIYNPRNWQQNTTATMPSYYQQVPQQNNSQQNNGAMIWVQGEAGAKAYVLPPNTTLPLWDSEAQVIYIKSVDSSGKPTMTILDYVDRNAPNQSDESSDVVYATKEQFDKLSQQFSLINDKLNSLNDYATKEQFNSINVHVNDLTSQIDSITNKITSMGKSQPNTNNNNRRSGNK